MATVICYLPLDFASLFINRVFSVCSVLQLSANKSKSKATRPGGNVVMVRKLDIAYIAFFVIEMISFLDMTNATEHSQGLAAVSMNKI